MSLYRTLRSFIGKNFVRPFEDFCAVNYPALNDFIFYHLRHRTRREDLGDAYFMRVSKLEN
ncbi:MAG: hypothetical protein IJT57_05990, partial [Selenomonadaceae bacterium]|nr:hypothetical protein [Selenomonadaceae bacterium]